MTMAISNISLPSERIINKDGRNGTYFFTRAIGSHLNIAAHLNTFSSNYLLII